jgi:hypothetical protein
MAVDVKVPYRSSAAALSADMGASAPSPATAAHQQVGHPSAVPAKLQGQAAVYSVSPALVSKLPLFFQLLLQGYPATIPRPMARSIT